MNTKMPKTIAAIWANTGFDPAVRHLAGSIGWDAASKRLSDAYRKDARIVRRYCNAVVRRRIVSKIADGHAHVRNERGMVALDYGAGKCTSSFVRP